MQLLKSFKKLKASSILESVIAITVISICVLVAFLIYLNIIKQNKSVHYHNAKHMVEFLTQESLRQQNYDENFFEFKHYTISKTVKVDKDNGVAFISFLINTNNDTHQINKLIPYNGL